jgi:K+-sensing histidine kinase KdpD
MQLSELAWRTPLVHVQAPFRGTIRPGTVAAARAGQHHDVGRREWAVAARGNKGLKMAVRGAAHSEEVTTPCATDVCERRPHPDMSRFIEAAVPSAPDEISCAALLAGLVHELRTPVTALATGSELLLDDLDRLQRDDVHRIVQTMHRGAIWLQGLIENLLYAATLAEGALRIYPRPLDLAELVRDVVPVVGPLVRQRSQKLRIVDRIDGSPVMADSRRIGQVLINLIANASKYSGPGTSIDVTLSRRGERTRLSVADRGPGLPPGDVMALFAPYTRGVAAGQAGIDGSGLGLAIVKSIVDLHGGDVGAVRRRGGGAVFWVELPSAIAEEVDHAAPRPRARERLA